MIKAGLACEFDVLVGLAGPDGLEGDEHWERCGAVASHVVHSSELNIDSGQWEDCQYAACPVHVGVMSQPVMYFDVVKVEVI